MGWYTTGKAGAAAVADTPEVVADLVVNAASGLHNRPFA